ncbi:arsenic resistance protein [Microbacterium sp. NM3R9]|nr:arsenic resistance protein [Microbacterium thalli]
MMRTLARAVERHQVALFLLALAVGAVVGLAVPRVGPVLAPAATPVLGVLLFLTFLGVPFAAVRAAGRDMRFLGVVLVVNFVLVPVVVFGLSRWVAHDDVLVVGVLLVLLTPCVDYVIVFAGLAGGARERLLAVTPVLMVLQLALLPVYLGLMVGGAGIAAVDPVPFAEAFVFLIVLPLGLAVVVQALARRMRAAERFAAGAPVAMVPVMMLTLGLVVASQIAAVGSAARELVAVVPVFVAFVPIAAVVGAAAARLARLDVPSRRTIVFSGVTRNSLVVLPLALALPERFGHVLLIVVTQTLVELIAMPLLVAVVPRVVRGTQQRR